MARLTTAARNALPDSAFAGPNRTYPEDTRKRAANARSRVAQFGSSSLQRRIVAKTAKKYPGMGKKKQARHAALAHLASTRRGY
jgi:hypothetical protein